MTFSSSLTKKRSRRNNNNNNNNNLQLPSSKVSFLLVILSFALKSIFIYYYAHDIAITTTTTPGHRHGRRRTEATVAYNNNKNNVAGVIHHMRLDLNKKDKKQVSNAIVVNQSSIKNKTSNVESDDSYDGSSVGDDSAANHDHDVSNYNINNNKITTKITILKNISNMERSNGDTDGESGININSNTTTTNNSNTSNTITTATTKTTGSSSSSSSPSSPYAYAYLIGGCNPDEINPGYRGFLYNVLVGAKILRDYTGSKADIILYIRMSNRSNSTKLPQNEEYVLNQMNVQIIYIPKPSSVHDSFYGTVMEKFRILELTQYRRVILLDADVIPNDNLDFLFTMSDGPNAILKENVVVSGIHEPANAGFFMLEPEEGGWEQIQQIIQTRERNAKRKKNRFDEVKGWGHEIRSPDMWKSRKESGILWNFHFAYSDQGLLYHWTKYVKKSVSIVFQYSVENWSKYTNGTVKLENTLSTPFQNVTNVLTYQFISCQLFMCSFIHKSGKKKPWLKKVPLLNISERDRFQNGNTMWWYTLQQINNELSMGIDFNNWTTPEKPPLGFFARLGEMDKRIARVNLRRKKEKK